ISAKELRAKAPERMIYLAVKGMLPKGVINFNYCINFFVF
ncbi:50S ribosomal protein L13, partial [Escherichia coli]|nr:50S ribosomal protein L13 [Escherichia coli]